MEFVYLMLNLLTIDLKIKQFKVPLEWFMVIAQQVLLIWLLLQPLKFLMAMSKQTKNIKKIHEQVHEHHQGKFYKMTIKLAMLNVGL